MRQGAVVHPERLADVLIQDCVDASAEKEALGQLAVIGGEHAETVLKHVRTVQIGAQSGPDLKHIEAGVLAPEADVIALAPVENPRLGRFLERGHQVGFVLFGIRRRGGVADGGGLGELASRQQAVEVAIELAQVGELIGRHGQAVGRVGDADFGGLEGSEQQRRPCRATDRAAHLGDAAVGERQRKARVRLHADANVLEVLPEERRVHALPVACVALPLRERRPRNHFRVGLGFRGLRYPFLLLERYRNVGGGSRHAALVRNRRSHPTESILDRAGHPVPAPAHVGFLGERKIPVVARVVLRNERPVPRP